MRSTPTRPRPRAALAVCALALSAGAALASSGCTGSSAAPAAAAGSAHPSGTGGTSGGSYTDSGAVLSALKNAGATCTAVSGSQDTALSAPGLRSISACSIGASGAGGSDGSAETVTATVFDNHTDAQAYADLLTSAQSSGLLIGSSSARAVLGGNWVVLVPDDASYASRVSAALGGSVVGPSASAAG